MVFSQNKKLLFNCGYFVGFFSKCNGVFNESSDGGTYTINFSGEVSAVEQVSASLHTLVKSIWHENVTLVKDVAKDKGIFNLFPVNVMFSLCNDALTHFISGYKGGLLTLT